MLKVPAEAANNPRFAPALALAEDILLTTAEVARHLRITGEHLRVLRYQRKGPPYLKSENGSVLYKMSDVLTYCLEAERRGKR